MVLGCALCARSGTVTWQGDVSTDWFAAGNWDGNAAPGAADDVVIDGGVFHPTLSVSNGAVAVNSLILGASVASTLTVAYADAQLARLVVASDCTVGPYGTLTHADNATSELHRANLYVGRGLTVEAGGRVTGSGRGFNAFQGPGKPTGGVAYGAGAGHGGEGGDGVNTDDIGGAVYGSITAPIALGSGGAGAGQKGGGAVILSVAGTTTVNGTIDANAITNAGSSPVGSGGSIFVTTGKLQGTGAIAANGGSCKHARTGQGGGGRIAIVLTNSADFGSVAVTAYGGGGPKAGGAGTIYLKGTNQTYGTLIVDNNGRYHYASGFATTLITNQALRFDAVALTNQGCLQLGPGAVLDLSAGGQLTGDSAPAPVASRIVLAGGQIAFPPRYTLRAAISARGTNEIAFDTHLRVATNGMLTHEPFLLTLYSYNYMAYETNKLRLTITGDLTIDPGGLVQATGLGYVQGMGPGVGQGTHTGYGPGSGHGGEGAQGNWTSGPNTGGVTYGSITAPTDLGSGGGGATGNPLYLYGGGAIQLNVRGALTNNGLILADSQPTNGVGDGTRIDGASGGSVFITAASLAGDGIVSANGGGGSHSYAGQGGGGRVAVILTAGTNFGNVALRAYGGTNNIGRCGGAGTVYLKPAGGVGRVLVDNGSAPLATAYTALPPSLDTVVGELRHAALVLTNTAAVRLTADTEVGDLFVFGASAYLKTTNWTLTVRAAEHDLTDATKRTPGPSTNRVDNYAHILWMPSAHGAWIVLQ